MIAPCLDLQSISQGVLSSFIVALSGISFIRLTGIRKSILNLPSFPLVIVNVGGKIVSIGPPPRLSIAGIASAPSMSTNIRPYSLQN